jgi:hypothetical protein
VRFVTHLDVSSEQVELAGEITALVLISLGGKPKVVRAGK